MNILPFSLKMVCKVLETISNSLHIISDFSRLSTAFIMIATLVSIIMRFLLLVVFTDMVAMQFQLRMRVKTKI